MGSVWKRLQRAGKRAAKVRFEATLEELLLEGGGSWTPDRLTVVWSRRQRRVCSKPRRWQPGIQDPRRGMVVWVVPETLEVVVTLYRDPQATAFDDKTWNFLVVNESRGRRSVVAAAPLELGRLAGVGDTPVSLSLRPRSRKVTTATLRLRLRGLVLMEGHPTDEDMQSVTSLSPPGDVADLGDFESDPEDEGGGAQGGGRPPRTPSADPPGGRGALLAWCRGVTAGYPGVAVTDFGGSWSSGLGFCALLHRLRPREMWQPGIQDPRRGMVVWVVPETLEVVVTLYRDPQATAFDDKTWNFLVVNVSPSPDPRCPQLSPAVPSCPPAVSRGVAGAGARWWPQPRWSWGAWRGVGDTPVSLSLRPRSRKVTTATLRLRLRGLVLMEGHPTDEDMQSVTSLSPPGDVADLGDFESDPEDEGGGAQGGGAPPPHPERPPPQRGPPQFGDTEGPPQSRGGDPETPPEISADPPGGRGALLAWCRGVTAGYPGVAVTDFGGSWSSGLGFCALLHRLRPREIDFEALDPRDHRGNNKRAFDAFAALGVPRLLDPSDMETPDSLGVMTFLSQVRALLGTPPGDPPATPERLHRGGAPRDPPGDPPGLSGWSFPRLRDPPPKGDVGTPPAPPPSGERGGGAAVGPPGGESGSPPCVPPVSPPPPETPREPLEPPEEESGGQWVAAELLALEQEQARLDAQAPALERELRELMDSGADPSREERLLRAWFSLVQQRNLLVRRQDQLQLLAQERDLERRFELLSRELRGLLGTEEWQKPPAQREREQLLLEELVALVNRRDRLVRDRHRRESRALEEDEELRRSLEPRHRRFGRRETCGIC
ncbi:EH domain-binding protein 1-like protein 1 [Haemorhous mexicanus]|uniref:EH domain-binding protein 1-like protein 1 n=1 Tax=Haemorhous mexicanus TaxID=30427 RepID=UPI0028BEA659|nr:EH domain-binding protein 1-like protein 1 [Haemorhous mexicanus]